MEASFKEKKENAREKRNEKNLFYFILASFMTYQLSVVYL